MKKSIRNEIFAVLSIGLVLCILFAALIFDAKLTKQTENSLTSLALALSRSYDAKADAAAQAEEFAKQTKNLRVTIIAADGTVLGDSEAQAAAMQNHADRAEIKAAASARAGVAVRSSATLGYKQMYVAVRTESGDYLRVAQQYAGMLADIISFLPALFVAGFVAFLFAMGVAQRFTQSITAPIADLSAGIKRVQDGGEPLIPERYRYEELQGMAGDINHMSAQIHKNVARLERERAKIDSILNNMTQGFVLLDGNQTVLLMNHAASDAFGCAEGTAVGKNLVYATRNVALLSAVGDVVTGGGNAAVDLPLANGTIDEVTVSAVNANDPLTKTGGAILLLSDVTAQRNAVQMRQQFFDSASHELKTPITSIKGFAELLCSEVELPAAQQKEISSRILKETTRMSSLIGDIIMISRLESGDITFDREVMDLAAIVSDTCADFSVQAQQADIALHCEVQPCIISASRREMAELVGNLVSNAIRYNHAGGTVRVSLMQKETAPVLTVFNTGEPIPPAYQARVFERFFRMDKGRSKAVGGTGLGLAIVKHIATAYGASVALTADENGNTFTITFPKIK